YNSDLSLPTKRSHTPSANHWPAPKTPLKLGGGPPAPPPEDGPKFLKEATGLPMRLIPGYKGTADIRVAVESGEVDGICGFSWASVRATWRKAIESGVVIV